MQKKVINKGTNIVSIDWQKPEKEWICINTDGAVAKNNEVGYGGLDRNNEGVWLGGFSKRFGKWNFLTVELWGVFEGLMLSLSNGYNRVETQVDNQEDANAIWRKKNKLKDMKLIGKIKTFMKAFLEVKVVKIHREDNKSVYTLAKYILKLHEGGSLEFIECPYFILNVLLCEKNVLYMGWR